LSSLLHPSQQLQRIVALDGALVGFAEPIVRKALNRLDAGEGTVLAETVAGKALPDEVVTHIAARADGVPLFVEELTRVVVESGLLRDEGDRYALDRSIPSFAIPPSLHASLLARLDRLGPTAKEIAQIGAAIGRDFSYELLAVVAQRPDL